MIQGHVSVRVWRFKSSPGHSLYSPLRLGWGTFKGVDALIAQGVAPPKRAHYFLVNSKDRMKFSRTFCLALLVMACVIVSTSGCERRPQPYAGIPMDNAKEAVDPQATYQ